MDILINSDYADAFMANPDVLGYTYKSFSILDNAEIAV